ncbi:MAG: bifunctional aldolase/short-chain dehydrogenase [Alphaproteobacteria bacterium]|nr:bifunctional aldolase/short-chain dehydrogenase [Alphaproteobacteria bacterium]
MQSRWNDADAQAYLDRYAPRWGEALALRVYSSRLIGADDALVLHGGGNTSVKAPVTTLLGDTVEALYIKGSGWDLASIEPQGFPAVDCAHMRRVVRLEQLTDEAMVNEQRTHMFDAASPNPSIETLLHAFFPARFVDHTHADAILALTNHPEGEAYVRQALGDGLCIVPYVKPGFDLARLAAACFDAQPDCVAMVLMQHGLFTWGETAREAYEHHIALVSKAEAFLAAHPPTPSVPADAARVAAAHQRAGQVAPLLRRALSADGNRWILGHRATPALLGQVDDPRLDAWVAAGPLTPDHVIRTKHLGCVVRLPDGDDDAALQDAVDAAIGAYRAAYDAYFDAHAAGGAYRKLDTTPRVLLVPGVGVFGVGDSPKAARICLDITEHTLAVKEGCEGLGAFEGLPTTDLFEVEYWSLEQAKLGKGTKKPLAGRVAVVTGGAGAIGVGVAKQLRAAGACVVLADRDEAALARAAKVLGAGADVRTVVMDVTIAASVAEAFQAVAAAYGGVDIVVPNAGVALVDAIVDLDDDAFRRVMEVNATGTFLTVREAGRQLVRQGTGGDIVLVSTKNVFGPGARFGAYSASKAAAHQLCKVAALELAPAGVRVNMVNPDAVFDTDGVPSGLWAAVGPDRARSKGLDPSELQEHYRQRNLLKTTISGDDVGRAVVFFASGQTPTTGASLPVDGGVADAFPR